MGNETLANLIFLFHICIILFMIIIPFLHNPALLILHITFSFCLLIHWYNNSDACSLTILESNLRGISNNKTFTHQFISPLYSISETEWSQLIHIITILLMIISVYYLYNSEKFQDFLLCYRLLPTNYSWSDYINCFTPLFII